MKTKMCAVAAIILGLLASTTHVPSNAQDRKPANETRQTAEEAFIYGFPMVMNYSVLYEYYVNRNSSQYKCPMNELYNTARVYTPKDTSVVTPNSDTPYSFACLDLHAEPMVISIPEIEKSRYYSVQLVDLYTFNYGYIGSRATGNVAGHYMIAGPNWTGEKPAGIAKVFSCETQWSMLIIRTQLFNTADLDNVKKVQSGYKLQPLSAFLKKPALSTPPAIRAPAISKEGAASDPFLYLNFILQFCPPTGPAAVEKPMRVRFAKLGIEAGKPFQMYLLPDAQRDDIMAGMKSGLERIKKDVETFGTEVNGWLISTTGFGDRAANKGNWLERAGAAMAGIYGNDAVEALYPLLAKDSDGNKPDCAKNNYTLTFPAGQLPPANAFWSVTMYDAKTQLLIDNPINRYLINSPMLPDLKKNADGSLTLYIQKDSPGQAKESNWLPAPNGPIYMAMRLYWPKESALNGTWKPPAVTAVR